MNLSDLQQWLVEHGQNITVDGKGGPQTRNAIEEVFTNKAALAITPDELKAFADRLGCSVKQLKAVATVESGGSAFDKIGRPKILYERHYFWKMTDGEFGTTPYSNLISGGYDESSWGKLTHAACKMPLAAFASCSWGRFQVMGAHWKTLGYESSLALAYSTVASEAGHYELLVRFIEKNNLNKALKAISTSPADNVAFAKAYNGPNYRAFAYDKKLAQAME